jgi:hypothetical protein
MLALRQLSEGLGVKRINGCIGTNLLYHSLGPSIIHTAGLCCGGKPRKT